MYFNTNVVGTLGRLASTTVDLTLAFSRAISADFAAKAVRPGGRFPPRTPGNVGLTRLTECPVIRRWRFPTPRVGTGADLKGLSRFPTADAIGFDAQHFRRTLRVVKLTDR